jgi:sporulation protein YlmC with PRC-barrel domain
MTQVPETTEARSTQFIIGAKVSCKDGPCGEVTRVIIDPIARVLTHIVVDPRHGAGIGRLVPVDLAEQSAEGVELACGSVDFDKLEVAEESEYLPSSGDYLGYGAAGALFWPYYGYGYPGMGMGMGGYGLSSRNVPEEIIHDAVPAGEVTVRRGDPVHATDGDIGRVAGLVMDTATRHVTHVLLQEGHLWGRKDVAIPIRAVTRVDTVVEVALTKQELGELPSVDVDHPDATRTQS